MDLKISLLALLNKMSLEEFIPEFVQLADVATIYKWKKAFWCDFYILTIIKSWSNLLYNINTNVKIRKQNLFWQVLAPCTKKSNRKKSHMQCTVKFREIALGLSGFVSLFWWAYLRGGLSKENLQLCFMGLF